MGPVNKATSVIFLDSFFIYQNEYIAKWHLTI